MNNVLRSDRRKERSGGKATSVIMTGNRRQTEDGIPKDNVLSKGGAVAPITEGASTILIPRYT